MSPRKLPETGRFLLQSHRLDTFKLSADPQFVEQVRDIVGLSLHPPDHALVLCLDEKSQVSGRRPFTAT
jgi:hypothetical protein